MEKHVIRHKKMDCISCGACAAITPDFWKMDDDGLSHLKESVQKGEYWERVIETEQDRAKNVEAEEVCPVQIIHVVKGGEK